MSRIGKGVKEFIFILPKLYPCRNTQIGVMMKTVIFAYYLNSEQSKKALYREQRLDFMCEYKISKRQKAVCDIDRWLL